MLKPIPLRRSVNLSRKNMLAKSSRLRRKWLGKHVLPEARSLKKPGTF